MNLKKLSALILSAATLLSLSGCAKESVQETLLSTLAPLSDETNCAATPTTSSEEEKSDIDTYIVLNDERTAIKGRGVLFEKSKLTIIEPGNYSIKGKLSDGQIYVDCKSEGKKVKLYLEGVDIYCSTGAPIHVESSPKETQIILVNDSQNVLSDNADRQVPDEEDNSFATATIYSRDNLYIRGSGNLEINANFGKGIFSRDSLKIGGGNFVIVSNDDAIRGKDSVEIHGGNFDLTSGGDAIRTSNEEAGKGNIIISGGNIKAKSTLDAIQAVGSIAISGGCFNLESGGGYNEEIAATNESEGRFDFGNAFKSEETTLSAKGIKAGGPIAISSGKFELNCLDDALHTNDDFAISGGTFIIKTNDDALHSDKTLAIASGKFDIQSSYEGIEAQVIAISGGKINIVSSDDGLNVSSPESDDFKISFGKPGDRPNDMPGEIPEGQKPPQGQAPDIKPPHDGDPQTQADEKPFGFKRGDKNDIGGGMDRYDESCKINISGGTLTVNAGGDGLDSNGDITMTGGEVIVSGSVDGGNAAIDYSGNFKMDGGTLAATGDSRMAQGISEGTIFNINANCTLIENCEVKITDSKGNQVFTFKAMKNANNLIFADKKLSSKERYTVYADGKAIGTYNVTYNIK